jgi:hypothetical protein
MTNSTNKDNFSENEWLKQIYKDAWGKPRQPTSKELWILKKKRALRALRAFLKRAYLFMLTSTLM